MSVVLNFVRKILSLYKRVTLWNSALKFCPPGVTSEFTCSFFSTWKVWGFSLFTPLHLAFSKFTILRFPVSWNWECQKVFFFFFFIWNFIVKMLLGISVRKKGWSIIRLTLVGVGSGSTEGCWASLWIYSWAHSIGPAFQGSQLAKIIHNQKFSTWVDHTFPAMETNNDKE